MYKNINNLIKAGKTVKVPVYSSIKLVNGRLIYEFDGFKDMPIELLPNEDKSN